MNIGTAQIGLVKGAADRLDDLISGIVVFAADKLGRKGGAGKDRICAKLCLQNIDAVKNFIHGVGNILQNDLVLRSGVRNGLSGRCLRQKLIEKCHGQSKMIIKNTMLCVMMLFRRGCNLVFHFSGTSPFSLNTHQRKDV